MPNLAFLLKEEIVRLARKELRKELEGLKKASTSYRSEIAALKRRLAVVEKEAARHGKRVSTTKADTAPTTRVRFSAKGLASQRKRLGLSAAALGMLLGVSAQSIYNWEAGKTQPRREQVTAIAAMRKLGKRQAKALQEQSGK
jgi:DNA-binding transcriptional regulator YiaG